MKTKEDNSDKFVFTTNIHWTDRQNKAEYVWDKYKLIMKGKILDVGADEGYLKSHLDKGTSYWSIGIGSENLDQQVNLEKEKIPFPDNTFDCVLCLDVLEHLENIHDMFDELCRVSRQYVIISLPNPWAGFWKMLRFGDYRPGQPMKFDGLPLEKPQDRHKWFFSNEEAEKFIIYHAAKNNMRIIQMDNEALVSAGGRWRRMAFSLLLRHGFNLKNIYAGPLWAVLEKCSNESA